MKNFKSPWRLIALCLMLCLVSACATRSTLSPGEEVSMDTTTFSFDEGQTPHDVLPAYRLAPGDVLDILYIIRTWIKKEDFRLKVEHTITVKFIHAPELDTSQKVRPDGNITLAYIGDVYVIDKTVDDLIEELKNKYRPILQIPELLVTVPEFRAGIKELKTDLHTAPRGLSRLTTVRPDGYATFPGVGDVFVAGKTVPEAGKILNELYQERYPEIHCDLFLEKHAGSQIYVVGQVLKPGAYSVVRPMTILEAIALAGGHIYSAQLNSVFVVRKHDSKMVATRVDLEKTLAFKSDSRFFYLQPNDIVYIPKTWLAGAAEVAKDLGNLIFFRGWGLGFSWELHDAGQGDTNLDF
jgi:polysaccharide export outer membrane protein